MSCSRCGPDSNYEDMCTEGQALYLDARRRWRSFMVASLFTEPDAYLWRAFWRARALLFEHLGVEDTLAREAAKNKKPIEFDATTARLPYVDS